ncbi:hypothetical protein HGI15_06980 [Modestobacter lapidis]|nr:hypothetical protein [Modestobacter lapidis]
MSGLSLLVPCPGCSSRDVDDVTPEEEDRGWWARLLCRACGHEWSARC